MPPLGNALAQSFTPQQSGLIAVDVFLGRDGEPLAVPATLTVSVREASLTGLVVGSATAVVPAGTVGSWAAPYVLHFDFSTVSTLIPGTRYFLQIQPDSSYGWVANSGSPYPGGNAFVGASSLDVYDFGFRTYYGAVEPSDTMPPLITCTLTPPAPDGANGWYRGNVDLAWSVADEESTAAVTTGCIDQLVQADQAEVSYTCSATSEGGAAGPVSVAIKRDATLPTISAAIAAGTLGANGWRVSNVTVRFTCFDAGSGIPAGACPADQVLTTEGDAVSSTAVTVTDAAGNVSAASNVVVVKIDKTGPFVTLIPDRDPDANGWYNGPVRFTASGDDEDGSGLASCDAPAEYSGPTSATASVALECRDAAGNGATGTATFKYDALAPAVTITPDRAPDIAGAYNASVTFTATGNDGATGWGGVTCDDPETYDGPASTSASVTMRCTDQAGNTGSSTLNFQYTDAPSDTTAPTIVASISAGTLRNGWYSTNVTVHFTCADTESGIPDGACPDDEVLSIDGASVTSTARTVTDTAGNTSEPSNVIEVKIDKTEPLVTLPPDREPNAGGWYTSAVSFTATGDDGDAGSGIEDCDDPVTYEGPDSMDALVTSECTDVAGNIGVGTAHLKYDATAPVASWTKSPEPNETEWNHTPVTVTFVGTDATSGGVTCDEPVVLADDGAGQTATGGCTDAAGNSATTTAVGINIDTTAPVLEGTVSGTLGSAEWYTSPVTVSFACTDGGSGIAFSAVPDVQLLEDGADQSVTSTGLCTDNAGNPAQAATESGIDIDTTAPEVAVTPDRDPDIDGAYDHAVTFTATGEDGTDGSGAATCDGPEVYSGPISNTATVTMECTDAAGNVGSATVEFKYIDSSFPVITFELTPLPIPVGGWFTSNVTLTWSVVDPELPDTLVTTGCVDQIVTTDRPYTTYECRATSAGGEASVVEIEFGRDATKPAVAASLTGTLGAPGWYTSDVTVTFTCTDAGSGVATDTVPDVTLTAEGAAQSVTSTGVCTDRAGNTAAAASVSDIRIDKPRRRLLRRSRAGRSAPTGGTPRTSR
jgi:hypothetical protein